MSFQLRKHKSALSSLQAYTQNNPFAENINKMPELTSRLQNHRINMKFGDCKFAVNRALRIKRQEYEDSIRSSIYKLNTTISWAKESQLHLQGLQKNQIRLDQKINSKGQQISDKRSQSRKRQGKILDQIIIKRDKSDGPILEKNLFSLKEESLMCFDDIFPLYRLGASLVRYRKRIYIYGGHSFKGLSNHLNLHYYDLTRKFWKKVGNHKGELPYLCTCYHTAEQYKQYLIFLGGISIDSAKNRRYFNYQICFFNVEEERWSNIRWNFSLRSHASTLYGNILFIYGGINEKDEYLNQIFFMSINANSIQQSTVMQYTTPLRKAGIAFHKIVSTYDIDPNLRDKIDLDGIISYGGKFYDGSVCSDASIFRINFKGKEGFNFGKSQSQDCNGWQVLSLKGIKPEGRYDHSMNIFNKKGICLIVGGINEFDQILADAWVMDLCNYSWIQAAFDSDYSILSKGMAGHTAACDENDIYIFGGVRNSQFEIVTKFISISIAGAKSNIDKKNNMLLSEADENA